MKAWFTSVPLSVGEERNGLLLPSVMSNELSTIADQLKVVGKGLEATSVEDIAKALERTAQRWLNKISPQRKMAIELLPKRLPFSQQGCERAIDALFEPLTAQRLLTLLDEQLHDRHALDVFVERRYGVQAKAFGSELALLILSGNILGIGIWDIVFCLLCKTPVLVKPSSEEPLMPTLFAQSLADVAPELAAAVAIVPWSAERDELTKAALQLCDVVIAYGTDETIQAIKRCTPAKVRVIERGHRFSVVIVTSEFANERTSDLLALDIARFDQRGCLSPQVCFVVGTASDATSFAHHLADSLARLNPELPPNLSEGEVASITQFRLTCEMLGATLLASSDASWTVIVWTDEAIQRPCTPSPLHAWAQVSCSARVVHIVGVLSLDDVLSALKPLGKFLQGVAIAASEELAGSLAEELGRMGANRICPVGTLQTPPIEWHQDGKHLLAELVRWCDFEPLTLFTSEEGWVEVFVGSETDVASVRWTLEKRGIPVSYEMTIVPTEPWLPQQRLLVPSEFANEAKQIIKLI